MLTDRLTHKVTVEREIPFRDDDGGVGSNSKAFATVWAGIYPLAGTERMRYAMLSSEVDTLIVVRRRPDIDSTCRIVKGRREWMVRGVLRPAEKDNHLEILATEVRSKTSEWNNG